MIKKRSDADDQDCMWETLLFLGIRKTLVFVFNLRFL